MAATIVQVKAFNQQKLTADIAPGGSIDPAAPHPSIHLFVNPVVFSPTTLLSSLTEASFAGYGAVLVQVWNGPYHDTVQEDYFITTTAAGFVAGAILGDQTAYGWYLLDKTGNLVLGETFNVPYLFHANGDTLFVYPKIYEGGFNGPDAYED